MLFPLYLKDTPPDRHLSPEVSSAISELLKESSFSPLSCLCGSEEGTVVAEQDKYGIPLNFLLCKNCGLMRITPYFTPSSVNNLYKNIYRRIKNSRPDKLFNAQLEIGEKVYSTLRTKIDFNQIKEVIEIGCGSGGIVKYFETQGFKAWGCDLDLEFIQFGKTKETEVYHGDFFEIANSKKIGPNTLVIINHVLEHIVEPRPFIEQLESKLPVGTFLYISVPGTLGYMNKNSPNQLKRGFMFAHPWNYDLNSLKYNLFNQKKFDLCYEDEEVNLILKKSEQPKKWINDSKYKDILLNLAYLRMRELGRNFIYSSYKQIKSLIRR